MRINYGIFIVLFINLILWFISIVGDNEDLVFSNINIIEKNGIIEEIICFYNFLI